MSSFYFISAAYLPKAVCLPVFKCSLYCHCCERNNYGYTDSVQLLPSILLQISKDFNFKVFLDFFLALTYFTVHGTALGREPTQDNMLCYWYRELSWRDWCLKDHVESRPFQELLKVQLFSIDKSQLVVSVQFTVVQERTDTMKAHAYSGDESCLWRQIMMPMFKLCRALEAWFLSFHNQLEACWEWLSGRCFVAFDPSPCIFLTLLTWLYLVLFLVPDSGNKVSMHVLIACCPVCNVALLISL